uniref:Uncharacterized protein n=1 Tax=Cacopsylla melanoneura TaxID=428564 RepID=A0A8D8SFT2_9HEMI
MNQNIYNYYLRQFGFIFPLFEHTSTLCTDNDTYLHVVTIVTYCTNLNHYTLLLECIFHWSKEQIVLLVKQAEYDGSFLIFQRMLLRNLMFTNVTVPMLLLN